MKKFTELTFDKLKKFYDPDSLCFSTTKDLIQSDEIIGQDRAVQAMEFGLRVKNPEYNIFIVGPKGTGKRSYAKSIAEKNAKMENVPDDWCYVNNFEDPSRPIAFNLPPGLGKALYDDMEELIQDILKEITRIFNSEEYEKQKISLIKSFKEEKNRILEYLYQYSRENDFIIKNTDAGFTFAPIINGELMSDKEYDELDDEQKEEIEQKVEFIQIKAIEILKKIKLIERDTRNRMNDIDYEFGLSAIEPLFGSLFNKYKNYHKVIKYLKTVQQDIMENLYNFNNKEEGKEDYSKIKFKREFLKKYKVNLLVDNKDVKGAPVIVEWNPNYENLVGKIEYENEQGILKTDFTMIRGGAIHKANGGYLILQAEQLLKNIQSWETLKRVLQIGEICIESLKTQLGLVEITSLKPEAIPINLKVILIGSPYIYKLLYIYDEDFATMFKIKVDFDVEMEANTENEEKTLRFMSSFCRREKIRDLDSSGMSKMLEYSHRIAGTQRKLTTKISKLSEILIEANVWAEIDGKDIITEEHIQKTFFQKKYRNNKIEEKIKEMYYNGQILFNIGGSEVGRINGLSLLDCGDYVFCKPSVITVTTFMGNKGIINIEREAELSGSIHDKGVMILEGYLNEKFAQKHPLNLTAKICFEQNYGGVDGDSASCAELYGLLSNLSDIPLKQNIAVTGSINQKGEVQPVGGINEKIEGFFYLCEHFGFTQGNGVIIPQRNIKDLVLCDRVIEAVKEGKFHIYPILIIDEGMEILTNQSFVQVCKAIKHKINQLCNNRKKRISDSE